VGPVAQGPYLNAVVALETDLSPRGLLHQMLAIEASQGRRRNAQSERSGPRTLDLDLLLYGNECINENGLEVPHPRLHERAFVLEPLCEVDPELIHPRSGECLEVYRARQNDPDAVSHWADSADWVVERLGSKR
jgi:2-amino-4-hydroxy-6-hydroxymethyldihydropteridine diphosphokinase